jgi:hypothetical protein
MQFLGPSGRQPLRVFWHLSVTMLFYPWEKYNALLYALKEDIITYIMSFWHTFHPKIAPQGVVPMNAAQHLFFSSELDTRCHTVRIFKVSEMPVSASRSPSMTSAPGKFSCGTLK